MGVDRGANGLCIADTDTPACATRMHTWRRSPTSTWCCLVTSRCSCGRRWSGGLGGERSARASQQTSLVYSGTYHQRMSWCWATAVGLSNMPHACTSHAGSLWRKAPTPGTCGGEATARSLTSSCCREVSPAGQPQGMHKVALLRFRAFRYTARVLMMQCCTATATLKQSSSSSSTAQH